MADKKFCFHCKKEIEEGKEVEIRKGKGGNSGYYNRNRYYGGKNHNRWTIYYLCLECNEKEEKEYLEKRAKENRQIWIMVISALFGKRNQEKLLKMETNWVA